MNKEAMMEPEILDDKKCGYAVLLGEPNAGKSSLMNACLGVKLAAVSLKPQTTRNRIMGICTHEKAQILFMDTAGLHDYRKLPEMNKLMVKESWQSVTVADVVCYLIDTTKNNLEQDIAFLEKISSPVILVFTKKDKMKDFEARDKVKVFLEQIPVEKVKSWYLVSSKIPESVLEFKNAISYLLPISPWIYDDEILTDRSEQFVASELIREQIFRQFGQDVPYRAAVKVERFSDKGPKLFLDAVILMETESQKRMVIGAGGSKIKSVGIDARQSLESFFQKPVVLNLFVKAKKDWRGNLVSLSDFVGLQ